MATRRETETGRKADRQWEQVSGHTSSLSTMHRNRSSQRSRGEKIGECCWYKSKDTSKTQCYTLWNPFRVWRDALSRFYSRLLTCVQPIQTAHSLIFTHNLLNTEIDEEALLGHKLLFSPSFFSPQCQLRIKTKPAVLGTLLHNHLYIEENNSILKIKCTRVWKVSELCLCR